MHFLTIILFALAVSIDGLGVGFAYGLRRLAIPAASLVLIGLSSATAIAVAMVCGKTVGSIINPAMGLKAGAVLMIGVGCFAVWQNRPTKKEAAMPFTQNKKGLPSIVKETVKVFKERTSADLDSSGKINCYEAVILGLALSLDGFAVGLGAALSGFDIIKTPILAGLIQVLCLKAGLLLGAAAPAVFNPRKFSRLPGCIIIFIGLVRIIR